MMLNENLSSLYEELRAYTRGTDISTPMLVLGNIFIRYAIDNRIGLVLDRNFDLYIQMARNLENPYHLFDKAELETFLSDVDEALEKDNYSKVSDILPILSHMWNEEDNKRFSEVLSTKSFRSTYQEFLNGDFRKKEYIADLLYTLSYQAKKDWREERSYSLGSLLVKALNIGKEDLVKDEVSNSELLLSSIAIESDSRTITEKENLIERLLSPLSRRNGRIEEGERNTVLLTETLPENIQDAFKDNQKIVYFAPSSLLLSSSRENLERRESLIGSGKIHSVTVLPPLTAAGNESVTIIVLTEDDNDEIGFADLNSKSKDREYVRDNQLTEKSIELIEKLFNEGDVSDGMTTIVDYSLVEEKKILVPMNYLEMKNEEVDDTEELEKKIDSLYWKLAALIEL